MNAIVLNGRTYRVLAELGRNDRSILFLCRHGLWKQCVLKQLKRCFDDEDERGFFREYQLLRSLEHPNIVKAIDFGKQAETGYFFLAMEYVQGKPLWQQVHESSEAEIFDYFFQTLRVCNELNSRGIVHCDIKPDNILVTNRNRLKLTDFGSAREVGGHIDEFSEPFLAPEHVLDCDGAAASSATDLYALGVSFYWILTGAHPYYPKERLASLEPRYFETAPVLATELNPTIDPRWNELLMGLIHTDPAIRLQTAARITP